jgi:MFS family permease
MAQTFNVSYASATLSVSLYLAMNAVFQLFVGPLSDRYGRRPVVMVALAIFCAASVGCIIAPSFEVFLICRLLQAVVVTGLVLSRAAIRDTCSQDQAASVLGYVTMGMAILPLIGPAMGGGLEAQFGWVASFWLLLGVGLFVFALTYLDMGETNLHQTSSMAEQFRAYPELLKSRRFWGYCLTASFSAGAYFAYLGGGAYVGREIFGLSPACLGVLPRRALIGLYRRKRHIRAFLKRAWGQPYGADRHDFDLSRSGLEYQLVSLHRGATDLFLWLCLLYGPRQWYGSAQRHGGHDVSPAPFGWLRLPALAARSIPVAAL